MTITSFDNQTRKPSWLRMKIPGGGRYAEVKKLVDDFKLHTVCQSAKCPNLGECWARGTATIMILGNICTRSCGFCAVNTGKPTELDTEEPGRVAQTVNQMKLKHVVITSVARDELKDGGASVWAETIRLTRLQNPECRIEVLIPDFKGQWENLDTVLNSNPDILNHNIETVPSLHKLVRPQAKYDRSIELLTRAKERGFVVKTGLMLGLGEKDHEIAETLKHIASCRVDILTMGQYLQPTPNHLPLVKYVTPEEFKQWKAFALDLGFQHVESGPMVRSSYHADEQPVTLSHKS